MIEPGYRPGTYYVHIPRTERPQTPNQAFRKTVRCVLSIDDLMDLQAEIEHWLTQPAATLQVDP